MFDDKNDLSVCEWEREREKLGLLCFFCSSPFLYPPPFKNFSQFVQASQALCDVIVFVDIIDSHLGLSVGQRRLKQDKGEKRNLEKEPPERHNSFVVFLYLELSECMLLVSVP